MCGSAYYEGFITSRLNEHLMIFLESPNYHSFMLLYVLIHNNITYYRFVRCISPTSSVFSNVAQFVCLSIH